MRLILEKNPQRASLNTDFVLFTSLQCFFYIDMLFHVSFSHSHLYLLPFLTSLSDFVFTAEEMDWDKNGQVTFREFLFGFINWVGIDADE